MPDEFDPATMHVPEFRPAFPRYSPECTELLSRIREARAIVEAVPILPAQEDELRREALVGTIHYSTMIEGNTLGLIEAQRAVQGELNARTKTELELVNYVDALRWVDRCHERDEIVYTPEFLLELHRRLTRGLGREGEMFRPEHEGSYRDGVAVVGDRLGNVFHEGPPPEQVPGRVGALFEWLVDRREDSTKYPGAVLAVIAHYAITDIHPFADGNGRAARTLAVAILEREGYLPHRIFSLERHYAANQERYYEALRSVRRNTNNHEEWLRYSLGGLATEYERVAARVRELNRLTTNAQRQVRLNVRQEQIITALTAGRSSIDRAEAQMITGGSERTTRDDLHTLVEAGILSRRPNNRYLLPRRGGRSTGRPREWDDERVERELRLVINRLGRFPTATELQRDHTALASAVKRHGGVKRWRFRLEER